MNVLLQDRTDRWSWEPDWTFTHLRGFLKLKPSNHPSWLQRACTGTVFQHSTVKENDRSMTTQALPCERYSGFPPTTYNNEGSYRFPHCPLNQKKKEEKKRKKVK